MQIFTKPFIKQRWGNDTGLINWLYPILNLKRSYIVSRLTNYKKDKYATMFESMVLGAKCIEQGIDFDHLQPITIKKENNLFWLYQGDKKIIGFDNAERVLEALGASKGIIAHNRENELFL